jgi:hypothetical protein
MNIHNELPAQSVYLGGGRSFVSEGKKSGYGETAIKTDRI